MRNKMNMRRSGLMCVAVLVSVPAVGLAQNALDHNLRVGSGGKNASQASRWDAQRLYNNAIVTGNAAGFDSFRGNVGYRAPGEFSATTASDDLFRFERSTMNRMDAQGQYNVMYRGNGSEGAQSRLIDPQLGVRLNRMGVSAWEMNRQAAQRQNDATRNDAPRDDRRADGQALGVDPLNPTANLSPRSGDPATQLPGEKEPDNPNRLDDRLGVVPVEQRGWQEPSATGTAGGRLELITAGQTTREWIQKVFGAENAWKYTTPGEDAYADLLRQAGRKVRADGGGMLLGTTTQAANPDVVPAPVQDPRPLSERLAEAFDRSVRSETEAPAAESVDPTIAALLDYDLPPMHTLAGSTDTPLNGLLREAESRMAAGQYFEAEERYARAAMLRPDHPLPRMGRVHAQVGAGLYLSAAQGLRSVLSDHPELVANLYRMPVLPTAERMAEASEEAKRLAVRGGQRQALLLLAYLAYQRDDLVGVRTALGMLQSQMPDDLLVPVLRRVWLSPERAAGALIRGAGAAPKP